MALKDRPRDTRKPVIHGAPCSIGQVYRDNLDDFAELAEIHAALYFDNLNNMQVVDEFAIGGYTVSRTAASNHRAKKCRCFNIDRDFCPECKRHLDAHDDTCGWGA